MILVIGATGNVGREIVPQLLDLNQAVRVFVRDKRKVSHLANRVEIALGDLQQPETIERALQGVDKVFLVLNDMRTLFAKNVVDAAKSGGVQHLVQLSTYNAEDPKVELDRWHHEKDQVVRDSGLNWTFLRPGQFMSNALQWVPMIKAQSTVFFPGGTTVKFGSIHPNDIAAVGAVALTEPGHENRAYQLSGPQLLTTPEQVEILARAIGKAIGYVEISEEQLGERIKKNGVPESIANALVEMFKKLREEPRDYLTNNVQQITKRPPRTFEEWCRENAAAFQ